MTKLDKVSKEEEKLMYATRDEWINNFYNTKEIDKKEFEKGINWLYTDLLKKKKPKIVYVDGWLSCILSIHILKNINKNTVWNTVRNTVGNTVWNTVRNTVDDTVGNTVGNTVGSTVRNTVGNTVWNTVRNIVWSTVRNTVDDTVRNTVGSTVRNTVRNTVGNTVRNTVGNTVDDTVRNTVDDTVRNTVGNTVGSTVRNTVGNIFYEYSGYCNSYSNFGWVSFYDYFEKIGVLKNSAFKKYKKLVQSGAFQIYEYENIVFAVEPPFEIHRNENGQVHSTEGAAIKFKDGDKQYYVNSLNLSEELFFKLKNNEYTTEEFFKEKNEEVKSACIAFIQEKNGDEGIFNFFKTNLKKIDTYVNKKEEKYLKKTTRGMNIGVYTLFKGEINNTEVAYIRCYCPSTDRMFFLGVDPIHTNAKDAIASLYRVPRVLKNYITDILRQGERYSTLFTNKIQDKLKNNEFSSKELKDLVSLSGQEYFDLIKYEY